MGKTYSPPCRITAAIVRLVAAISEELGRHSALIEGAHTLRLRRENRIRTIHASLAIENNTLTLDQVTAVINGKRVLGLPREIQEVRNALAAYDAMAGWNPGSRDDLLAAHGILMAGLVDEAGRFRSGGVGVFQGENLIHMAPPAERVQGLMQDLLDWLARTDEHPLIAGCVFHYELEFIHPFADGNGRMGRLWQTLILGRWKPVLEFLPVETVIRERQAEYYKVLGDGGQRGDAAAFVEFILTAMLEALMELRGTDQVIDQVTVQVRRLLHALSDHDRGAAELMAALGLSHRPSFRANYLTPAILDDLVELTQPDSPRSPTQKYRVTDRGRELLKNI